MNTIYESLTYQGLLAEYPSCEDDIKDAYAWYFDEDLHLTYVVFSVGVEPMSAWADCIEWISDRHDKPDARRSGEEWHEPKDEFEERVEAIMAEIRAGGSPLPVFCSRLTDLPQLPHELAEGYHRIVAFHRLGLETVTVVSVDEDATEELKEDLRNETDADV
jgi:hypothetical protein